VEVIDSKTAFELVHLKAKEGWEGVRKALRGSNLMEE